MVIHYTWSISRSKREDGNPEEILSERKSARVAQEEDVVEEISHKEDITPEEDVSQEDEGADGENAREEDIAHPEDVSQEDKGADGEKLKLTDWTTIKSLEDLMNSNLRYVPSLLFSASSKKQATPKYLVTGQEFFRLVGPPNNFSRNQMAEFLRLGNSSAGCHTRQELGRLYQLAA